VVQKGGEESPNTEPMRSIGNSKSQKQFPKNSKKGKLQTNPFLLFFILGFGAFWKLELGFWSFRCCAAAKVVGNPRPRTVAFLRGANRDDFFRKEKIALRSFNVAG
jgi:hypothetical protein